MLGPLDVRPRDGDEAFRSAGASIGRTVGEFWRCSDLLSNTRRGVLAEFIVGSALGCLPQVRREWEPYDLVTRSGIRVEVKSSAYLQEWKQNQLSTIQFDVRPTRAWNSETGVYEADAKRQADVYVFCLFANQDGTTADPLDLDQWVFYVLASSVLDEKVGAQKTISLRPLVALGALEVGFEQVSSAVREALERTRNG